MLFKKSITAMFLVYTSMSVIADIPEGNTINICGDGAGWPPYLYETPEKQVQGYDVDILSRILTKNQLLTNFEMQPWKRCLQSVDEGKEFHIATSSSYSKERDKTYLLSRNYYNITPSYFYSKKNFPNGLNIHSPADFKKYSVCGLFGYNYTNFGVDTEQVDTGTKNFSQLVEKTDRKRCDLFLARYEIFVSFSYLDTNFIKEYGLGSEPIPGIEKEKFYLLISRNYEHASELKRIIDKEIGALVATGKLQAMINNSLEELKIQSSQ